MNLEQTFDRFVSKLRAEELPSKVTENLVGSLSVLCGLRYDPNYVDALYRNLSMTLEDSTTDQLILTKDEAHGRLEEVRSCILDLGTIRFGPVRKAVCE